MITIVAPGVKVLLENENMRDAVNSFLYDIMFKIHVEHSGDCITIHRGMDTICEIDHNPHRRHGFYVSNKRTYYNLPDAYDVVTNILADCPVD